MKPAFVQISKGEASVWEGYGPRGKENPTVMSDEALESTVPR